MTNPKQLTPSQALAELDKAVAELHVNRVTTHFLERCVQLIAAELAKKTQPIPPEKPTE